MSCCQGPGRVFVHSKLERWQGKQRGLLSLFLGNTIKWLPKHLNCHHRIPEGEGTEVSHVLHHHPVKSAHSTCFLGTAGAGPPELSQRGHPGPKHTAPLLLRWGWGAVGAAPGSRWLGPGTAIPTAACSWYKPAQRSKCRGHPWDQGPAAPW